MDEETIYLSHSTIDFTIGIAIDDGNDKTYDNCDYIISNCYTVVVRIIVKSFEKIRHAMATFTKSISSKFAQASVKREFEKTNKTALFPSNKTDLFALLQQMLT